MSTDLLWKKQFKFLRLKEFIFILGNIGIGSSLLPILSLLIIRFFRKLSIHNRIIKLTAAFYGIFNLIILLFYHYLTQYQDLVVNIYSIIEFILLMIFYFQIQEDRIFKRFLIYIIPLFLGFSFYSFYILKVNENYLILNLFEKIILFTTSLLYILRLYKYNQYKNLTYNTPYFYTIVSIMFYNASTFFISIFENFIRNDGTNVYMFLWPIFQISGILYYTFFAIGLWKQRD